MKTKETNKLDDTIQELRGAPMVEEIILMAEAGCSPEEIKAYSRLHSYPPAAVDALLEWFYSSARLAGLAKLKTTAHNAALNGDGKTLVLCLGARTEISANPAKAAMDQMDLKQRKERQASAAAHVDTSNLSADEALERYMKIYRHEKKLEEARKSNERRPYDPEEFDVI